MVRAKIIGHMAFFGLNWPLLASGQIIMRKVDGWERLSERPIDQAVDLAA